MRRSLTAAGGPRQVRREGKQNGRDQVAPTPVPAVCGSKGQRTRTAFPVCVWAPATRRR